MKTFLITYIKYGTVCSYHKSETIQASSAKMALKKFYNTKNFGDTRTRKQWMEYEQENFGITYSEPTITEIPSC